MTTRRQLLLAFGALATLPAYSQQPGKVWRIGYLSLGSRADVQDEAFLEQLRSLGYVEGRNLQIEFRWAGNNIERLNEFAAELVRLKVDVITASPSVVGVAAKRATSSIPIVVSSADPIAAGLAASLARPGGNVTGVTSNSTDIAAKRLQLMREVVPKVERVAVLTWKNSVTVAQFLGQTQAAAQQMGIALALHRPGTRDDLAGAFAAMQRGRAQALIVQQNAFTGEHRQHISDFARTHRLPSMFESRGPVDAGGLMSYGPNQLASRRRVAHYVDLILKGAKPADLPIEQPTRYEFVVNLKTAKALGIKFPQSVLARTDEVIQ